MFKLIDIDRDFVSKLLAWYELKGRKDLPWQVNKTPYRVWVSEIMLQQTQVSTVLAYYDRFLTAFPTVQDLSRAQEDAVLHLWTGLGYYSRARNLHHCARIVCDKFGGTFPDNLEALESLPGIGKSTAAAILSLAFNQKATILDGNVKRVITRYCALEQKPKEIKDILWELAEALTPDHSFANYTQAIMDLGATVCTRKKPNCAECPIQTSCAALRKNIVNKLPMPKVTKQLPIKNVTLLIVKNNKNEILLEKRLKTAVWRNLWSFPELEDCTSSEMIQEYCYNVLHLLPLDILYGKSFRHTFSHYHLNILPVMVKVKKQHKVSEPSHYIWYNHDRPPAVGLPGPVKKILQRHNLALRFEEVYVT